MKGDFVFYENQNVFMSKVMTLCLSLYFCNGIKVSTIYDVRNGNPTCTEIRLHSQLTGTVTLHHSAFNIQTLLLYLP